MAFFVDFDEDLELFTDREALVVEDLEGHREDLFRVSIQDALVKRNLYWDFDTYNLIPFDLLINWEILDNQWKLCSLAPFKEIISIS